MPFDTEKTATPPIMPNHSTLTPAANLAAPDNTREANVNYVAPTAKEPARSSFLTIWTAPRTTFRNIIDSDPEQFMLTLGILLCYASSLFIHFNNHSGDHFTVPLIIVGSAIFGTLLNLVYMFLNCAFLTWTGRWIGGKASHAEVRAAYVWSSIPEIAGIPFWFLGLALVGSELFMTKTPHIDESIPLTVIFSAILLILFTLEIWGFVLFIIFLAEVQHFPAWKALGNIMLAVGIVALPVVSIIIFCCKTFLYWNLLK